MKKLVLLFFAGIIAFSGCRDSVTDTVTDIKKLEKKVTYLINEPVFMSTQEFRDLVKVTTRAEAISDYGKICFYEGYIYISATEKGIHIINNSDPANPQNIGFIELPGNVDMAIRNGKLYADALIDLVWFDISNPAMPEFEGRLENVFAKYMPLPPTDNEYYIDYNMCYDMYGRNKGVVVGWEVKERTELPKQYILWYDIDRIQQQMYVGIAASSPSSSVGKNGSMSRFTIYKDYLYSVNSNQMYIVDLSGDEPKQIDGNIYIGGNVETIFSYKDNMFMGTPTGMVIYSVTNPLKPEFMSSVSHVFGCDPVVVENDIAYVTIHSGNSCGQTDNDLLIYDVSNVKEPKHIVTYAMTKPKGLGIDNGTLFICDDGLKIFNASNPQTVMANRLAHYSGMEGFDVIPFDNVLMMIAEDGLYQYDYSDLTKIQQISKLPIVKK